MKGAVDETPATIMDEPLALAILSTSRLVGRPWRTATSGGGWRRNGRAGAILRIDAFAVIAQAVSCLNHLVKNAGKYRRGLWSSEGKPLAILEGHSGPVDGALSYIEIEVGEGSRDMLD